MWLFEKKITKNIGSENDDILLIALKKALDYQKAVLINKENILVGSQEIQLYNYKIGKARIRVIIETFVGVSLNGKETVVNQLLNDISNLA